MVYWGRDDVGFRQWWEEQQRFFLTHSESMSAVCQPPAPHSSLLTPNSGDGENWFLGGGKEIVCPLEHGMDGVLDRNKNEKMNNAHNRVVPIPTDLESPIEVENHRFTPTTDMGMSNDKQLHI
ncbi:hypothetical protein Fot_02475 [Forsythia ovata]|uniref:Uncharacterized protein n=1 Tax=Forsythia ovata TaxID=205694 RepID=A0ABD1X7I0_9LAMI